MEKSCRKRLVPAARKVCVTDRDEVQFEQEREEQARFAAANNWRGVGVRPVMVAQDEAWI